MHSKSVLVSVIFEKDDEAGRRGLFERQTVFKSLYSRNLRGDFLIVFGRTAYYAASAVTRFAQTVLEAATYPPVKTIRKSAA